MQATAYSYIRFSRPEQLRGDSLRRQLKNARDWAEKRGVVLDDSLRDLGISAYRGQNRTEGALAGFLALVESGRVSKGSFLLVESLDRLSREAVIDVLPRFLALIKSGIVVVTLMDGQEYSAKRLTEDTSPLFISLVIMTRAHEESRTKAKRLAEAWTNKRAQAAATRAVVTSRVPAWLKVVSDKDGKRIVIIPERVEIIRRIFAKSIAGQGKYAICRDLNQEKVPAFRAKKWQPSYVSKVISNRAVVGELQAWSFGQDGKRRPIGDAVPGYYPAVVDELTWQRANTARERRSFSGGRHGDTRVPILRGLVRCKVCGARMLHVNKGPSPRGGRYLSCSDRRRGLECLNDRNWDLESVEELALKAIGSGELAKVVEPEPVAEGPTEQDLEAQIARETAARKNLLDLVEEEDEEAKARYRQRGERIKELRQQISELRRDDRRSASEPTWAQRQAAFAAIMAALDETGEESRELRTRLAAEVRGIVEVVHLGLHSITMTRRTPKVLGGRRAPSRSVEVFNDSPDHIREMELHAEAVEERRATESAIPQRWKPKSLPRNSRS
ncbi:recombinase family protein [Bosea sp. (in: a-proteobacteria)]|uniref:recombinase family protein n=1 Tax=Bosea sp. (in: a-proteobacteria) TaxID=1871050 RepID=UPI002615177A|nr:recombinase family protein [Bosea sp. (in: a-proteobacteria)]MCO5091701.1 recombinase family protein [Bosea sp. (in: a-proteobacteria)]